MTFPRAAGFSGDEQVGSVFQRALIAEALIEASVAGFQVDWAGIHSCSPPALRERSETA
jgi:hypothetical protein